MALLFMLFELLTTGVAAATEVVVVSESWLEPSELGTVPDSGSSRGVDTESPMTDVIEAVVELDCC